MEDEVDIQDEFDNPELDERRLTSWLSATECDELLGLSLKSLVDRCLLLDRDNDNYALRSLRSFLAREYQAFDAQLQYVYDNAKHAAELIARKMELLEQAASDGE